MQQLWKVFDRISLFITLISLGFSVFVYFAGYELPRLSLSGAQQIFFAVVGFEVILAVAASAAGVAIFSATGNTALGAQIPVLVWSFINYNIIGGAFPDWDQSFQPFAKNGPEGIAVMTGFFAFLYVFGQLYVIRASKVKFNDGTLGGSVVDALNRFKLGTGIIIAAGLWHLFLLMIDTF
ncbi:MAG: hypothetical protein MRY59_07175 [Aquisalinus sp.]|nr:hypothetical protein [Aquisalinus sp.]